MRTMIFAAALAAVALPVAAQMPPPGSMNTAAVTAGTYTADGHHTQVAWTLNHLGFNSYHGLFGGGATGTLTLDPANPSADQVSMVFPIDQVVTTVPALNTHIQAPDLMDAAKYPTATFTSTRVTVNGTHAMIEGNLTLHGLTIQFILDERFTVEVINPLNKLPTVGFEATATIKRSDFGINYLIPALGNDVDLAITAAFEKK